MYIVMRPTETTVTRSTCGFHERHPTRPFPGCTCSMGISTREKDWSEMTADEKLAYSAALRGEHPDGRSLF